MKILKAEKMSANEKTSLLHRLQIGVGGVFGVLIVLMLADVVLFDTAEGEQAEGEYSAQDGVNPALVDVEDNDKEEPLVDLGIVPSIEEGKGEKPAKVKQNNDELVPDLEQEKIDLEATKKGNAN